MFISEPASSATTAYPHGLLSYFSLLGSRDPATARTLPFISAYLSKLIKVKLLNPVVPSLCPRYLLIVVGISYSSISNNSKRGVAPQCQARSPLAWEPPPGRDVTVAIFQDLSTIEYLYLHRYSPEMCRLV